MIRNNWRVDKDEAKEFKYISEDSRSLFVTATSLFIGFTLVGYFEITKKLHKVQKVKWINPKLTRFFTIFNSSSADSGLSSWNMNMFSTSGVIH